MTSGSSLRIGRVSVNINGDFEDDVLIEKAKRVEGRVDTVWVGESDFFRSPFHVARLILENTNLNVGFGILRAGGCERALQNLKELLDYEGRIFVGIAAGDGGRVSHALECIKLLKEKLPFPVLGGGTGRRSIDKLSRVADGMLLNHVSPQHVRWAAGISSSEFNAAYGPALILPSEFEQDLLLAAALVMGSSVGFLREMGYLSVYDELKRIDLMSLIERRQKGEDLSDVQDYRLLMRYKSFLLDRFTLSGDLQTVADKTAELLKVCDHVVLGDPFFRDENFDRKLAELLKELKKRI
ncbi:hypothetical protein [Geoglobus ahangari]